MMPSIIRSILTARTVEVASRILLTFPFWMSGIMKLVDFSGGVAEMERFGLEPAWLFNAATVLVQLGGSALIIANRATWLGAGALGVFTALTIPIAHAFWRLEGAESVTALHVAGEHVGMIGALVVVSILACRRERSDG